VSNLALVAAVIYPPNDVRAIVDQMAKHIATSSIGAELEQRVRLLSWPVQLETTGFEH
jgi:hypothetical protein